MSRRDTVIVAALINAGLLIILFVSALKNQEAPDELALLRKEAPDLAKSEVVVRTDAKEIVGDEVDQVLKQYTRQDPLQPAVVVASVSEPVVAVEAVSPVSSFAEDLQKVTEVPAPAIISPAVETKTVAALKPSSSYKEIKVKAGDVLEKIARRHHTTVAELMRINQLSSTRLKIGQVLKVPALERVELPKVESIPVANIPSSFYTVKPGDNPWTIAVKNHMKVEDLLRLNNMTEEKARKLKPGDQIKIR